jgi:DNA-binding NarL/FixJ family response regulator
MSYFLHEECTLVTMKVWMSKVSCAYKQRTCARTTRETAPGRSPGTVTNSPAGGFPSRPMCQWRRCKMLRVVRSKVPPKQNQHPERAKTMTGEESFPVYVVDQNRLAARYLLEILAKNRTLRAVTLEDLIENKPGQRSAPVFIVDRGGIDLPLAECLRVLRERYRNARFVVLDQEQCPEQIGRLLSLGIHGFVPYPLIGEQLAEAVHCVVQGKLWISSGVLEAFARQSIASLKTVSESRASQGMTQRESEVMELVKRRLSNKEIGECLNIRESTVKFHLSNIFSKLQVNRRSQLQDKGQLSEIWRKLIAS